MAKIHKEDDLCPLCNTIVKKNHICVDKTWDEEIINKKTQKHHQPYKRGGAKRTHKF